MYRTFTLRRDSHKHALTTRLTYAQIVNRLIGTGIIVTELKET